jgi:phosphatidylinositol dimannoside acyltransferase
MMHPYHEGSLISMARKTRLGQTWRTAHQQIAECVVLPMLAVALPWSLAWRTMRWLADRGRFFRAETTRAAAMSSEVGFVQDPSQWAAQHRLTRMVDYIDPALSLVRSDRWMDRHLAVEGEGVPDGPCVFIGFHYGTGFWSLRHLRRKGHRVSFVAAPYTADQSPGQPLRVAFMRLRKTGVEKAGGAPVIHVGGSSEKIRVALRQGSSVLGLVDVLDASTSAIPIAFLGHRAWFPVGLLRLARSENVPMIGYLAWLDPQTGTRHLRFMRLPDDPNDALHVLAATLESAVRNDPAAWHLWAEWPRFAQRRERQ